MSRQISLLVVDDHTLVRDMLADRLSREVGISVVGTAPNAGVAVRKALELQPTIVLMDIDMPGMLCFEAAGQIRKANPETAIVFLSAYVHDRYVEQALEVGAAGYITKDEPVEVITSAVRAVASGGSYFSAEVRARLVVRSAGAGLGQKNCSRTSTLTQRELEILCYVSRGLSRKEIAGYLFIAPKTVAHHIDAIMIKLDIHDRVELARLAIREGLVKA